MTELLTDRGVTIHTGAKVLEIRDGLTCVFEKEGQKLTAEGAVVILATGRKPDTAALGLEAAGVATERGFVLVDDELRTTVPHIFAIGDLTGKQQLAHVATAQGIVPPITPPAHTARCAMTPCPAVSTPRPRSPVSG